MRTVRWIALALGHPGADTLNRYVDGALARRPAHRVSVHLIACRRCRATVDGLHRLRAEARALPGSQVPAALLGRVLARRAAGERVILPTADPAPHAGASRGRTAAAAAAVVGVVLTGLLALGGGSTATAASDDGALSFVPARPRAGDTIAVTYHAPPLLAREPALVLRARLLPALTTGYREPLAPVVARVPLHRAADGSYRGRLVLPADAARALLAVEDTGARHVDSRDRRYWAVGAHDDAGRLTYAAALAAADHAGGRGWEARHEAARALVAAFPDSVEAWQTLAFVGEVARGESDTAARALHRRSLARFDGAARRASAPSGETLAALMWYAGNLGDSTRRAYWRARLLREAPRHPMAVQERAVDIIERHRARAAGAPAEWRAALPALERLWADAGPAHPSLATFGFQVSTWADDARGLARWGPRYAAGVPGDRWRAYGVAREFVRHASLRAEGMRMLRALLGPRDPVRDPQRSLSHTVADDRREGTELEGWALQRLGEALLADGARAAALDTLRLAAAHGWNLARLRGVARAALTGGDTVEAARTLALVAADPHTSRAFADSARALLGLSPHDPRWRAARAEAPGILREQLLATATRRPIRGDSVRLVDASGRARTFAEIARGRVTVVVFGLRLHGGSPARVDSLRRIAAGLAERGMQLVAIGLGPRPADAEARARGLPFGVYFDPAHDAERAFDAYGVPMYFVVDAAGDLRFAYSEPSQLLAQASVLAPGTVARAPD